MIHKLREQTADGDLTLGEIFGTLKTSGHSIVMIFLCLPFLQPIPIPGLSTPLGLLVGMAAILQIMNREPWIPKRWEKHNFDGPVVKKILEVAEKTAERVSPWVYPRLQPLVCARPMRWLNTLVIVVSAVLLSLPLPIPFSNTIPTLVIIAQALGFLEKDGVLVLASYLLFGVCLFFFAGIGVGVENGLHWFGPGTI